jgi:type VI secretion system protein ImpG
LIFDLCSRIFPQGVFNKYYQDELAYLRELGQEFARAYPEGAHFIGEPGSDPDVERLLEGFAFLTARIRQKLDDEIPEFTHAMVDLFWPHYLRPVPSFTVVQFEALPQAAKESRAIPRGAELRSVPVDGTPCRFRTVYDVTLAPLALEAVALRTETPPSLRLKFRLAEGVPLAKAGLSTLRLHLAGDAAVARALYLCLACYARRVWAQVPGGPVTPLPGAAVRPVGFSPDEAILPVPTRAFAGFRLLHEYFAFPSKFMFVDLAGLEGLAGLGAASSFELTLELSRLPAEMPPVTAANVLLGCAPAVNLFPHEAQPVRADHTRTEYPVRAAGENPAHYEIYSLDRVQGVVRGTGRPREYLPLFRFARPPGDEPFYYRHRLEPSVAGEGTDLYVSPLLSAPDATLDIEVFSFDITCTNRALPSRLKPGDVSVASTGSPTFARFRNLTKPTPSVRPPLDGDLHWRLLSHLALNYRSLVDLDSLRTLLSLYHFRARADRQAENAHRLLLEGIRRVSADSATRMIDGHPVRGLSVELEVEEDRLGGEGEAYLLGAVLNEFFAQYVSLNAFARLTVKGLKYGEVHAWPTRLGERILL